MCFDKHDPLTVASDDCFLPYPVESRFVAISLRHVFFPPLRTALQYGRVSA
jgi:hypothetical protein